MLLLSALMLFLRVLHQQTLRFFQLQFLLLQLLQLLRPHPPHLQGQLAGGGEAAEAVVLPAEGHADRQPNDAVAHLTLFFRSLSSSTSHKWWPSPYQHVSCPYNAGYVPIFSRRPMSS